SEPVQAPVTPAIVEATPIPPAPKPPLTSPDLPQPPAHSRIKLANKETSSALSDKMQHISLQEKETETERKGATIGIASISLKGFPISPDALVLIPEERARELNAMCFLFTGPELRIGAIHPEDPKIKELVFELEERHKTHAELYIISEESLQQGLKLYAALPKIKPIVKGVQITEEELEKYAAQMSDFASIASVLERANVTDVIAVVIAAAIKLNSSDVHVEAEETGIAVRFRVDGILQEVTKLDHNQWKKIINRIKLIASLKINVSDQAQDGRFTIFQKNKQIDVRTSTIPTAFGESVVMRLLNPDSIALEFEQLGFRPAALKKLTREIEKPNGMIITTGPTGSGKTTTLYAILRRLNTKDVKIITLEDPVEYKVEGINQSQIDYSKDYTFGKGLRSILRQDPDIVMVGEIRDLETAEIAIQAALTGHLLMSTIHTNDAAGAVPRFMSMGVKPFLLAPAINAIMGQRLLRKLCQACKKPAVPDAETLTAMKAQLDRIPDTSGETKIDADKTTWYGPGGCEKCNSTGYKGRVGAYEILVKDPEIEKAILGGVISEYEMREIAQRQGMITMTQDGLLKASEGLTSIEEVKRNLGL
ncbi:MAG: GspE/PulE family protein, partial [Candidatus Uhrbacteria bacterium]|nr:GspE/PulE family protein [Candidatus Uhrbacteria bacterium]